MKWYDKSDEPVLDIPILTQNINNNFMLIKQPLKHTWKWLLDKHKIKYWIYCDELKQLNE